MPLRFYSASLLLTLDLLGTAVFAVEGALAAIKSGLDLFGVLVLAFAAGLAAAVCHWSLPRAALRQ